MAEVVTIKEATLLKGTMKDGDEPTAQRIYYITFDEKPADHDEIVAAEGLPAKGDPYKEDDARKLKTKTPAMLADWTTWIVTCDYEQPTGTGDANPNPLLQKDRISGDFTSSDKPYFKDFSTPPKSVTNSSWEPFDKNPENKAGVYQFCITGNRASIDPVTWGGYFIPACATNSSSITIRGITFPAHTLLMLGLRHDEQTQNSYHFNEVQWSLGVGPDWTLEKIDDRGYTETDINIDTGELMSFDIVQGTPPEPVKSPYPLDGSGTAKDDPTEAPAELEFCPQPEMDFSIFGWTAAA